MGIGLLFAVLVGLSWVVTGAAVGQSERLGFGAWRHQCVYTAMYGAAALLILLVGRVIEPNAPAFSLRFDALPALLVALWGVLSYGQNLCVGLGMRRGSNGSVWTIAQSGFVFPVALGFATGNTPVCPTRVLGVLFVLFGVWCCGRGKNEAVSATRSGLAAKNGKRWLVPALGGFFLCGLNQCMQTLASFFPAETRPSPLLRVLFGATGVLCAVFFHRVVMQLKTGKRNDRSPTDGKPCGVFLAICLVNACVFLAAGFFFHYNALDRLTAAGRISIAGPAMLSACLTGFLLYGITVLHEKPKSMQLAGTAFAILGAMMSAL